MLYKNVSDNSSNGIIKDVDTKTGTVTGYFSIFGNVDSDGDMIMPGAYTRTLNNNYKRLKHLNQHRSYEPLSSTNKENLKVSQDQKGLFFESKISPTSYGKDVIQLYNDGVLTEHSIGYEVIKSRDSDNLTYNFYGKDVPVKELQELKLWEGSSVTWGANALATTESVKSMTKEQCFEKMNGILKAIKNGKYENDEIFEMLELHFKQLEQHILDLSTPPAKAQDTPTLKAEKLDTAKILSFIEIKKLSLTN